MTINIDENSKKDSSKKNNQKVPYPRFPLADCIRIIQTIREVTAENSIDKIILAKSLNTTPSSSQFRMLIVSCNRYGLIEGNYNSERINISSLGQKIIDLNPPSIKHKAILESIANVSIFEEIISKYDQHALPSKELFLDIIMNEFNIPEKDLELFYNILIQNLRDYSFLEELGSKIYIYRNESITNENSNSNGQKNGEVLTEDESDFSNRSALHSNIDQNTKQWIPKVFVSHSKNEKILGQIENALETVQRIRQTKIDVVIATKEETTAVPIPDKIFSLMRECNCAIINISADEENRIDDEDYSINGNVLIEIGGAFLMYDRRVILLVDKRLENKIPSNLQGLYRCYYSGEELSGNVTLKLIEAMADFFESVNVSFES